MYFYWWKIPVLELMKLLVVNWEQNHLESERERERPAGFQSLFILVIVSACRNTLPFASSMSACIKPALSTSV